MAAINSVMHLQNKMAVESSWLLTVIRGIMQLSWASQSLSQIRVLRFTFKITLFVCAHHSLTVATQHGDLPRTENDGGNSWKRLRSSPGLAHDDDDDDDDDDHSLQQLSHRYATDSGDCCLTATRRSCSAFGSQREKWCYSSRTFGIQ